MLRQMVRRLIHWCSGRRFELDLQDEIEFHRLLKQQALEREGVSAEDAVYAARRALGNITLAREDARQVWTWRAAERLWADLRYATRSLRHHPTFCTIAVLTLAIGVGSITTIFSVVDAQLWKPFPFPDPNSLVAIDTRSASTAQLRDISTRREFVTWRSATDLFESLGAFTWTKRQVLRANGTAESVRVMPVTSNFFAVLGRGTVHGRTFSATDDSTAGVVMLSESYWRRASSGDPAVVGKTVLIDGKPHAIVGVVAGRIEFIDEPDLYSLIDTRSVDAMESGVRDTLAVGRLRQDIDMVRAKTELNAILQRLAHENPADYNGRTVDVRTLQEAFTGYNWRSLYFFLGAAACVLLLACANLANLLLARAQVRRREFAIRGALGSGHGAIIQLQAAEAALLAVLGGAGGLLLAAWMVGVIQAWLPASWLARGTASVIDGRVFVFAVSATTLAAGLFGVLPALLAPQRHLHEVLGQSSPGSTGGTRRQHRARSALVVAEVTMALVLLFGAGLFVNSLMRLTRMPLGFEPENRLTLQIPIAGDKYADRRQIVTFADRLLQESRGVPGVEDATVATGIPLASGPSVRFVVEHRPRPVRGSEPFAIVRSIAPGYHRVLGIRLLSGRDFTDDDGESTSRVAVINENLARHLFPDQSPVGQSLELVQSAAPWLALGSIQIVGVVANCKEVGLNEVDFNGISVPLAQHPASPLQLIVRAAVPPSAIVEPLRRAVFTVDSSLPVYNVRTMAERVRDASRGDRFNFGLIATFALIAVLMSAVGIYGTMSYSMEQRTREFGVRLALGATSSDILILALRQSTRLGLAGAALGLGIAFVVGRLLGNALYMVPTQHDGVLYGVTLTDPSTLAAASATIVAVAALAGFVPARRATRIDPVVALRYE